MRRGNASYFLVGILLCLEIPVVAQNALPKLAVLDRAGMERLEAEGVSIQLNLLWLREDISLLETNERSQHSFILLNNCMAPHADLSAVQSTFGNEFEYPSVIAFYKSKARDVLKLVSNTITVTAGSFNLGQYDMATKEFPIVEEGNINSKLESPITLNSLTIVDVGNGRCLGLLRAANNATYEVAFPDVTFSALRMDEDAAKSFVSSVGDVRHRRIAVQLDVEILQGAPRVSTDRGSVVTFPAKVNKATAVTLDGRPLGVLYP
jgi:hypothetical protein